MTTTTTTRKSTPAKAPAKKAAPKPATKAAQPAATKLRWTIVEEFAKGKHQTATVGDRTYAITRAGDGWKATVKKGGKTTVLVQGTFGRAYTACVADNKAAK